MFNSQIKMSNNNNNKFILQIFYKYFINILQIFFISIFYIFNKLRIIKRLFLTDFQLFVANLNLSSELDPRLDQFVMGAFGIFAFKKSIRFSIQKSHRCLSLPFQSYNSDSIDLQWIS